jgi:hypothetical protein
MQKWIQGKDVYDIVRDNVDNMHFGRETVQLGFIQLVVAIRRNLNPERNAR